MGAKPATKGKPTATVKRTDAFGRELIRVFLVEPRTKPSGALGSRRKFVWMVQVGAHLEEPAE